ncbi:GNAT family N-acetyltransferase [Pseudonocardia sp. GCM10023141]|uniref:GNAT family N-acetyltransferase n=1 Tax=Pseudonocardia sp. GCM10023141 TaxID=3252653 RepID=UPI003622F5D0
MDIEVRGLVAAEVDAADRIVHDAFGTFLGADVFGDTALLRTRFGATNTQVIGAFDAGELIGSSVLTRWGSVAFLGPLSVSPKRWDSGIGRRLVTASLEVFDAWGVTHQGLFTFADSPRHHGLYQRFDFWPRFLTAIMSRPVTGGEPAPGWLLSAVEDANRPDLVEACAGVTDALYPGLDARGEIASVLDQALGDVVLVGAPDDPTGFAVCHHGTGTEAGTGIAYVKFAAVRPGRAAPECFAALLEACAGYAAAAGAARLVVGVNTARHGAYRHLIRAGFRSDMPGVTMHRANRPGYDHPDAYLLDDWR